MNEPSKSTDGELKIRRLIAFIGILLVIISQFIIFTLPEDDSRLPPATILLSFAGVIVFVLSLLLPIRKSWQIKAARIQLPEKAIWITTSIIFSSLAAAAMIQMLKTSQTIYLPVLISWFMGCAFYIFAFREWNFNWARFKEWISLHRTELILITALTVVAGFLRIYTLGRYPRVLDGDEGLMGLFAQSSTSGQYANPFALWENFGALYLQAINLVFRIFGVTPFALRLLPAISGTLAIPALYLFARQIAGKRVAFLSALLLTFSHAHIHFSRIASVGYIHSTWLVPLELYLLISGLERKKSWRTAAAGVLLAIHFSVYLTSQIILGMILVFGLITLIFMRKWFMKVIRQMGIFWGGFFVGILPEFLYILHDPNSFFNRLTQDGTFQTGWLGQTIASTGQNVVQILGGRVIHVFLSLIYYPARDFYGSNIPMLTLFGSVLFLIGLGIALLRIRSAGMLLLNGYFWAPLLAIGIFSLPPSADSYRVLIVLPPAMVMAGMAIDEILELLGFGWEKARRVYVFLASIIFAGLIAFNLWAYFGDFVGQCRYGGDLTGRFASYLGGSAKMLQAGNSIFLLSDPTYFYGSHASTDFLSGNRPIVNFPDPVDGWQGITGDTVIASPPRIPELETWMRLHPGGKINYVFDCKKVILLSYTLP